MSTRLTDIMQFTLLFRDKENDGHVLQGKRRMRAVAWPSVAWRGR